MPRPASASSLSWQEERACASSARTACAQGRPGYEEGVPTYLCGDGVLLTSVVDGWWHDAERLECQFGCKVSG